MKVAQPTVVLDVHWAKGSLKPFLESTGWTYREEFANHNNFVAVAPKGSYSWNTPTKPNSYSATGSRVGGATIRATNRTRSPYALSTLAEERQALLAGPTRPERPYAPYDASLVTNIAANYGVTAGDVGQFQGWAWANEGAATFLFELIHDGWDMDGVKGGLDFWDRTLPESEIREVSSDSFSPIGHLISLASNPTPQHAFPGATPPALLDLAVESLRATDGACDSLETFSPTTPWPADTWRRGQYGDYAPVCRIRNWGNQDLTSPVDVKISIETDSGTVSNTQTISALASGASHDIVHPTNVSFAQGQPYIVRCEIVDPALVEVGTVPSITFDLDQSCFNSLNSQEYCEPSYASTFHTNNRKTIRMIAEIDEDHICHAGRRLPLNMHGEVLAKHLSTAVFTPLLISIP